eukprot:749286-Hanusia_phi.AAC.1
MDEKAKDSSSSLFTDAIYEVADDISMIVCDQVPAHYLTDRQDEPCSRSVPDLSLQISLLRHGEAPRISQHHHAFLQGPLSGAHGASESGGERGKRAAVLTRPQVIVLRSPPDRHSSTNTTFLLGCFLVLEREHESDGLTMPHFKLPQTHIKSFRDGTPPLLLLLTRSLAQSLPLPLGVFADRLLQPPSSKPSSSSRCATSGRGSRRLRCGRNEGAEAGSDILPPAEAGMGCHGAWLPRALTRKGQEYEHYDDPHNGDMHVIIPKKLVALKVGGGGRRRRRKKVNDEDSGACGQACQRCGLAGRGICARGRRRRRARTRGLTDGQFHPRFYLEVFREMGVKCIIRLNEEKYDPSIFTVRRRWWWGERRQREGRKEEDADGLEQDNGIEVVDLYFEDSPVPPSQIIFRFLKMVHNTDGMVAVHCDTGLGRTGTLIGMRRERKGMEVQEREDWEVEGEGGERIEEENQRTDEAGRNVPHEHVRFHCEGSDWVDPSSSSGVDHRGAAT